MNKKLLERSTSLEEELRAGRSCVSTTVGDSMEPMLRNRRDMVILAPVTGTLKRYDLPLYRRPNGQYVLNRIAERAIEFQGMINLNETASAVWDVLLDVTDEEGNDILEENEEVDILDEDMEILE